MPNFVKVIKDVIDNLGGLADVDYEDRTSSSGASSALEALRNGDKSTAQSILNNSVGKGSSSSSSSSSSKSSGTNPGSAFVSFIKVTTDAAKNAVNSISKALDNPKSHTGRIRGLSPDEERVIVTKDESILTPAQLSPVAQKLMNATDLIEQLRNNVGLLSPTLPSFNVPNVVKNDNSSSQNVYIDNIVVKEPVQDMNGLLHSVMQEAKLYHLRTKNIR